ncbi:hypothetical protein L7F22_002975 [Adiantum nelumboides]|nr:hypothetical protein [Adiantum nelumboides]
MADHSAARDPLQAAFAIAHRPWTWLDEARVQLLHRLSFNDSSFPASRFWDMPSQKFFITDVVMSTPCLKELSISMQSEDFQLEPAIVCAWLIHARKTLTSLVFMNKIVPQTNLLDKLGGTESLLQNLQLKYAYIPTINPAIHIFPALIDLSLVAADLRKPGNLELLLTSCPKLKSLLLNNASFLEASPTRSSRLELCSSSLKILYIQNGLKGVDSLVLHAQRLRELHIRNMSLDLFELVQSKEHRISFMEMSICNANIATLRLGEGADKLTQLQIASKNYEALAKWDTIYQNISNASNLLELRITNMSVCAGRCIDINKLATTFPRICLLELDYENASDESMAIGPRFEKLRVLVLNKKTKLRSTFTDWVARLLEKCSSLNRLEIRLHDFEDDERGINQNTLLRAFTSSIISIGRKYPQLVVEVTYFR